MPCPGSYLVQQVTYQLDDAEGFNGRILPATTTYAFALSSLIQPTSCLFSTMHLPPPHLMTPSTLILAFSSFSVSSSLAISLCKIWPCKQTRGHVSVQPATGLSSSTPVP